MFERYLTDLMTEHFGHVIANLDYEKMRLTAWNGSLVLRDVELNRFALGPHSPVEIECGTVGRLEVRIPWKIVRTKLLAYDNSNSKSSSSNSSTSNSTNTSSNVKSGDQQQQKDPSLAIAVVLTNVNILLVPRKPTNNNTANNDDDAKAAGNKSSTAAATDEQPVSLLSHDEADVALQQSVQAAMDAELLQRVALSSQPLQSSAFVSPDERASTSSTALSLSSWRWKLQERAKALLQNLSVTVQNIHVRYEDPGTCLGFQWNDYAAESATTTTAETTDVTRYRPAFAIGITLKEFSIQTAGANQEDNSATAANNSNTTTTTTRQLKVAAAKQLAAYWDSNVKLMAEHCPNNINDGNNNGNDKAVQRYYEQMFGVLNDGGLPSSSQRNVLQEAESGFQSRHSFVLDPFSPSIRFGLAAAAANAESTSSSTCNTMDMVLPPCRFSLSRSLLEDVGYLRKSLAVWQHAKKGLLLPKETLRRLTRLRPKQSAVVDPRGWWNYAYAAVLALSDNKSDSSSRSLGTGTGSDPPAATSTRRPRRWKGWVGLSQALGRRRKYVSLYRDFLRTKDPDERLDVHTALLCFERTLLVTEVVAFRIAVYTELRREEEVEGSSGIWEWISDRTATTPRGDPLDESGDGPGPAVDSNNDPPEVRSVDHRSNMFVEMAMALHREQRNIELQQSVLAEPSDEGPKVMESSRNEDEDIAWRTSLECAELSLQIMDSRGVRETFGWKDNMGHSSGVLVAIVRLSCAFAQEQTLYRNGSWDMTNRIGSFVVIDCTSSSIGRESLSQSEQVSVFPTLVGLQSGDSSSLGQEEMFYLDGVAHQQSIWLRIRRLKKLTETGELGSTTTTTVRVLPLEVVYSTAPVESLNHVLNAASIELADDYSRIASRMTAWRERQQTRLLRALAHKQKKIVVDVVVGAPVLLLPEGTHRDSPLLILTLGELQFSNDNIVGEDQRTAFDDQWRIELTDIQVQRSTISRYRGLTSHVVKIAPKQKPVQHLIEPFSLNFAISTKIQNDVNEFQFGQTSVKIRATLPRLAVNMTSSAVRLLRRLQAQWYRRKKERRPLPLQADLPRAKLRYHDSKRRPQSDSSGINRRFEFEYVAPLFSVRLENDVDGRDKATPTPIFDLGLRGIEGKLLHESSSEGVTSSLGLKVRTLGVTDLYQRGGEDFALLLSSVSPEYVGGGSSSDLVTFKYKSHNPLGEKISEPSGGQHSECVDRLSIHFNELYVEWNPETIAALNLAISLPSKETTKGRLVELNNITSSEKELSSNRPEVDHDEFFDANGSHQMEEDAFFDAASVVSDDRESWQLSEIPESERSSLGDLIAAEAEVVPWTALSSPVSRLYSQPTLVGSPWSGKVPDGDTPPPPVPLPRPKPLEVTFELSKLRVNFNKESRRRRVVTAEMDGTSIRYRTMALGGSRTLVTIGNLSFTDCECLNNNTLYREILGLQTGVGCKTSGDLSSLLEMEMIMKPRSREYVSLEAKLDDPALEVESPVSVDYSKGVVHGFDNYLRARFSPMRFVFLEQLWFEVVDYFFSGIVANEVWGDKTPAPGDKTMLEGKSVSDLSLSFTRFDVSMESPVIMFPVSSCSTDFIRLEAAGIAFRNRYSYEELRPPTLCFRVDGVNKQWYNNCAVDIKEMTLHSWSGNALNQLNNRPAAHVSLCWPVGPSGPVNVPKWKVDCDFEELRLVLDRPDYALLQNIIQYNIGDASHHLDEWRALQSLPPSTLSSYYAGIRVHYGYDKKDSTPSTFDVTLKVPVISFTLKQESGPDISSIQCSALCWTYGKLADRVSKQKVTCDVDIVCPSTGKSVLSSYHEATKDISASPDLTYTSTSDPFSNNTKTLQIVDAYIDVIYPIWKSLSSFFQNLPQPTFLSPDESIQVGDRWYRIGEHSPRSEEKKGKSAFDWIEGYDPLESAMEMSTLRLGSPMYEFHFSLVRPGIRLESDDSALVLSIENVAFVHRGEDNLVRRHIEVEGVEVQTRGAGRERRASEFSLIRPWSMTAAMNGCNGKSVCSCKTHTFRVDADMLHARAAFSDMLVALDIGMRLSRDMRASSGDALQTGASLASPSQSLEYADSMKTTSDDHVDPRHRHFNVKWEGFRLVVADDSGRHFLGDQDLVVFLLQEVSFSKEETRSDGLSDDGGSSGDRASLEYSMHVRLRSLDIIDCLQSEVSPFRSVLTIRQHAVGISAVPTQASGDDCLDFAGAEQQEEGDSSYAVGLWSRVDKSKTYRADLRSIEMQYNPSVVVALQRFIGRLAKEARRRHVGIFSGAYEQEPAEVRDDNLHSDSMRPSSEIVRGTVDIQHIAICLNKEYQHRRLLETTISGSRVEVEWNPDGSCIHGYIGECEAIDPNEKNGGLVGAVMRSAEGVEKFVEFRYKTFARSNANQTSASETLPVWIVSHLRQDPVIDDFLDISIGNVETVYLRDRTEELMDYLSNGLPGKGMGATSRVAKGFVNKRIQKRSFFNVHMEAPTVAIPRSQATQSGISIRLGDFAAKSWIAVDDAGAGSSRMLSVVFSGVSSAIFQATSSGRSENNILSEVDFAVESELAATGVSASCRLSDVMLQLSYLDYIAMRMVLRENVGKKINKEKWDNLEVALENETFTDGVDSVAEPPVFSNEVTYSTSARLVRYGQSKNSGPSKKSLSLALFFDSLSVVLRRNSIEGLPGSAYDMLLARGQGFELALGRKADGDQWLNVSLKQIFVFDLGSKGRLGHGAREGRLIDERVNGISLLMEGYSQPEQRQKLESDAQIVIKVDQDASSSGATKVVVVVSYLSVTAVLEPLTELIQFFSCEWTRVEMMAEEEIPGSGLSKDEPKAQPKKASNRTYHLRFVSNYPRLVLPADGEDRHSRALVLQGLSIANASFQPNTTGDCEPDQDANQEISKISVNADFQEVSSQMVPDIYDIVCVQQHHVHILDAALTSDLLALPRNSSNRDEIAQKPVGVPLLLPLTVMIEFEQTALKNKQKDRTLGVSVDPLSIMLSNEDLQLVRSVLDTWSTKTKSPDGVVEENRPVHLFDALFLSQRLGLGLRKESGRIVVDNIANTASNASIQTGDVLHAINGEIIENAGHLTLSEMVSRLALEPRPLTVTFSRNLSVDSRVSIKPEFSVADPEEVKQRSIDKIDISLSAAVVTLMEKEVPLFRGSVSKSKIGCHLTLSHDKDIRLDVTTSIGIDYYNLRLWDWEPCLEQGVISLSSRFQESHLGARELAVEIGDRDGGLCVNLTDSLGITLGKLLEWRDDVDDDIDAEEIILSDVVYAQIDSDKISIAGHKDLAARRATNAAFRFARRQANDTAKPFVFRNMTGISVAFVPQKQLSAKTKDRSDRSFVALGDYSGLQEFEPSEIMVVASEEELKFRVDVISIGSGAPGQVDPVDRISHFPCLTVALQETNGVITQPIKDLHIDRPGETLLPLTFSRRTNGAANVIRPQREWLTWLVEQIDETSVITLGTSIRVVSLLDCSIELGIESGRGLKVKPIGSVRLDKPYCLPLWLSMHQSAWKCYVRLSGGYDFVPLFAVSPDGCVVLERSFASCVECRPKDDDAPSAWLAVTQQEEGGILTIGIDCAVTLHNALPSDMDWEINEISSTGGLPLIDGSSVRKKAHGRDRAIKTGEHAEILSRGWRPLRIRLRPANSDIQGWSAWTPLVVADENREEQNDLESLCFVSVKDALMLPLPMGLRIVRKNGGLDVTLYAEMWCTNCTNLSVVFGCPRKQIMEFQMEQGADEAKSREVSAAEATLKEISSLFESGEAAASLQLEDRSRWTENDVVRLPGQTGQCITEECFEYIEVEASTVRRRWWASENPFSSRESVSNIDRASQSWEWIDKKWRVDAAGRTSEGWETSPELSDFSPKRNFNPIHRYRRRRWTRKRAGLRAATLVKGVDAYFQPTALSNQGEGHEKKRDQIGIQVAVQVDGGKWSLTSMLPSHGKVHGVIRAAKSRWPNTIGEAKNDNEATMHELCYAISPLEGVDWGLATRSFLLTSRFLLRNDSTKAIFEVKQTGTDDCTAVRISPGQTAPFHWGDFRLPELVCVRPAVQYQGRHSYKWSGGFDPLTIGPVPLRIRKAADPIQAESQLKVHAVKVEVDIRSRTGGTGINLTFREEDSEGEGSLYRIENFSTFPIWISQDGVLANPLSDSDDFEGDVLNPSGSVAFALDVPYRQGKYTNRKAASMAILLRARLALAPMSSRAGIETTKVISLANEGERVRLNPAKLVILSAELKSALQNTRVVGFIHNDGPTRVLTFRLMENERLETEPGNSFGAMSPTGGLRKSTLFAKAIYDGAVAAAEMRSTGTLPSEEKAVADRSLMVATAENSPKGLSTSFPAVPKVKDLVISFRASFSGLMVSLVDAAPSEIAVITFKNMNAIATWDMLRTTDSTIYVAVRSLQVDNMVPNAPFPVAVCPFDLPRAARDNAIEDPPPLLVVGLSFAPKHKSGIVCLKSATVAPRNLAVKVDLAFLVRLQKFAVDMQGHFQQQEKENEGILAVPNIDVKIEELDSAAVSGVGRQKFYFGGLTILPCNIKLSVAPARALTTAQATLEGIETSAIHQAVRKGDIRLDKSNAGVLGVKVGSRNKTPLAVVRGLFKSFVVDGLLRLDGASLNFAGVSLRNHTSTGPQLTTALGAHYLTSLRQNLPALLGSMAAIGNPLGLVRGLGEGVGDFVLEPVRGFQRSVQEMDASHLVDGVARGTLSLARHTVGGFADSAAMLTETFSKNMANLTLDRRYAQKRDRGDMLREHDDINVASGLGSGVQKLVSGFLDGVTGVVKAPIRGAEKRGFEGFAKGLGKGLLGLLVKPIIGISDGLTDVMIGVKGTVDGSSGSAQLVQVRPRRALYGREKAIRSFQFTDAAASALMLRTRLAGEPYLNHLDMGDRVALFSVKRVVILGRRGEELLVLKLKHIESVQVRMVEQEDGSSGWGIIVVLNKPRQNGSKVEVITCTEQSYAVELSQQLEQGRKIASLDSA